MKFLQKKRKYFLYLGIWLAAFAGIVAWYLISIRSNIENVQPQVIYHDMEQMSGEHILYAPYVELEKGEYNWYIDYSCENDQEYEMIELSPSGQTTIDKGILSANNQTLELNYRFDVDMEGYYYYLYFNYDGNGKLAIKNIVVYNDETICMQAEGKDLVSSGFGAVNGMISALPYHYATYFFDHSLRGDGTDVIWSSSFNGKNIYYNVTQMDAWGNQPRLKEDGNNRRVKSVNLRLDGCYDVDVYIEDLTSAYVDIYALAKEDSEISVYANNDIIAYEYKSEFIAIISLLCVCFLLAGIFCFQKEQKDTGYIRWTPVIILMVVALYMCKSGASVGKVNFPLYLGIYGCMCNLMVDLIRKTERKSYQLVFLYCFGALAFILLRTQLFTAEQLINERFVQCAMGIAFFLPFIGCGILHTDLFPKFRQRTTTKELYVWQKIIFIVALLLWILIWLLSALEGYLLDKFAGIAFEEMLFHLVVPLEGTSATMVLQYFVYAKLQLTILLIVCLIIILVRKKKSLIKQNWFLQTFFLMTAVGSAIVLLRSYYINFDVREYVEAQKDLSTFIEAEYVSPDSVAITFPEQKRNLIYIFLESMESTYCSKQEGGAMEESWIPQLTKLAQTNTNFSQDDLVGGFYCAYDTNWTAAAMVSQTSGLPLKVPALRNCYGKDSFLPGIISLGDILEKQGYNQELLIGSDGDFAYRKQYFEQHGNYTVWDYNTAKQEGRIPEDYEVWWGFEDSKLFDYAKDEITRLAEIGEPFNFTMLTADTHFPDGYVCELCPTESERQYENVIRCSDQQVAKFVAWIQEQTFYENTTIMIVGDHLTMDTNFTNGYYDQSKDRAVYNCVINAARQTDRNKNRKFSGMDMFPTTLSALGANIEGNRLGLGTDLYSETPTLSEEYGYEYMDEEFMRHSQFYNKTFM